jgi:hypothetical protein
MIMDQGSNRPCRASGTLIGARGWDHDAWVGGFYPEDLPADWRLSYYANAFRAVLVPADELHRADPDVLGQWTADVPEAFGFYLEVSGTLMEALGRGPLLLTELSRAVHGRLCGFVLDLVSPPLPEVRQLERWLAAMVDLGSVSARWMAEAQAGHLLPVLRAQGVGRIWEPGLALPSEEGAGCVGRLADAPDDVRRLRALVEAFRAWSRPCGQALLYFEGAPRAYRQMEEARVIAELLGG